jgi:3-oxoacyl-[acyl-carrier protein] reductase
MDLGLAGRVAVVLGSTSGLGRASAEALAAEGAHLVVVGRRAELVDSLSAALSSAVGVTADLLEEDAPARVAAAAREAFGGVDVLVLNGGGPKPGAALDLDVDDVRTAIELLLTPHVAMVREVLPAMREAGWGRIIAVGSTSVQQPNPILAASNLGRAALSAYLKTLAGDVARDGVVSLDQYRAERTGSTPEAVRDAAEDEIPIGRYGRADEFAAVVAFLAGEQASYVTGEQVRCDGGLVAGY